MSCTCICLCACDDGGASDDGERRCWRAPSSTHSGRFPRRALRTALIQLRRSLLSLSRQCCPHNPVQTHNSKQPHTAAKRSYHLVRDVGLLVVAEQRDRRVRLGRQHVDERVAVAVQRDRRARLEQLAVERAQDAHVVVGARRGADDAGVGVHHLEELADHERHRLYPLDLLLRPQQLALEVLLLLLDVLLLLYVGERGVFRPMIGRQWAVGRCTRREDEGRGEESTQQTMRAARSTAAALFSCCTPPEIVVDLVYGRYRAFHAPCSPLTHAPGSPGTPAAAAAS